MIWGIVIDGGVNDPPRRGGAVWILNLTRDDQVNISRLILRSTRGWLTRSIHLDNRRGDGLRYRVSLSWNEKRRYWNYGGRFLDNLNMLDNARLRQIL